MGAAEVTVNGQALPLAGYAIHTNTLDFLRDRGLTGAKEGCAEGECGACSVLVARPSSDPSARNAATQPTEWVAINACLTPIAALDGQELVTAEGLGTPHSLHPVQRELAVRGGSQCGYCTPGFVCSMAAEYYRPGRHIDAGEHPAEQDSEQRSRHEEHGPNGFDLHALSGNLCRCTGYRPIRDAAYALGPPADADPLAARRSAAATAPALTRISSGGRTFTRPATLADALQRLRDWPETMVLAGSTDFGVEVNLHGARPDSVLVIDRLPELRELSSTDEQFELGAGLTFTELDRRLAGSIPLLQQLIPQFASRLIRNAATLGGNLGTGSPIGDAAPALLALQASLVLANADGEREVALADYFTGYRQTTRRRDELIRAIRIPRPLASLTAFHKLAKRRFDDISSVAVAIALELSDSVITKARIGVGGVAATPLRAYRTEAALVGRPWSADTVRAAAEVLRGEGTPLSDHRASADYRTAMLGQSLLKLYAENTPTVTV